MTGGDSPPEPPLTPQEEGVNATGSWAGSDSALDTTEEVSEVEEVDAAAAPTDAPTDDASPTTAAAAAVPPCRGVDADTQTASWDVQSGGGQASTMGGAHTSPPAPPATVAGAAGGVSDQGSAVGPQGLLAPAAPLSPTPTATAPGLADIWGDGLDGSLASVGSWGTEDADATDASTADSFAGAISAQAAAAAAAASSLPGLADADDTLRFSMQSLALQLAPEGGDGGPQLEQGGPAVASAARVSASWATSMLGVRALRKAARDANAPPPLPTAEGGFGGKLPFALLSLAPHAEQVTQEQEQQQEHAAYGDEEKKGGEHSPPLTPQGGAPDSPQTDFLRVAAAQDRVAAALRRLAGAFDPGQLARAASQQSGATPGSAAVLAALLRQMEGGSAAPVGGGFPASPAQSAAPSAPADSVLEDNAAAMSAASPQRVQAQLSSTSGPHGVEGGVLQAMGQLDPPPLHFSAPPPTGHGGLLASSMRRQAPLSAGALRALLGSQPDTPAETADVVAEPMPPHSTGPEAAAQAAVGDSDAVPDSALGAGCGVRDVESGEGGVGYTPPPLPAGWESGPSMAKSRLARVGATLDGLLAETDSLAAEVARSQGLLAEAQREAAAAQRGRRLASLTAGAASAMASAGGGMKGPSSPPHSPPTAGSGSPSGDPREAPPSAARAAAQGHLADARALLQRLRASGPPM